MSDSPAFDEEVTRAHYDASARSYDDNAYQEDSPNRWRLEVVKRVFASLPRGRILDAGCGSGQLLMHLGENGWEGAGCDLSDGMLEVARDRLGPEVELHRAKLQDLSVFEDGAFDHIACLGVLPYIPEEEESACYAELHRVLKPGGLLVSAHQNELFDLFTLNRYTLRWHRQNVFPLLEGATEDELAAYEARIAGLLCRPEAPEQHNRNSARDQVFTRPENPLTFGAKLRAHGFEAERNLFYNFHVLPPLALTDARSKALGHALEVERADAWQGHFLASTFVNVARRLSRR